MTDSESVRNIDQQLREAGNPDRADKEQQYLKSDLVHYGATVPRIRAILKPVSRGLTDHDDLIDVVHELWWSPADPAHDRRFAAATLLADRADLLTASDLPLLETLLRESRTWALVDTLTPYPLAALSEAAPAPTGAALNQWAVDDDFWLRRAALLAHLIPLREGGGDWQRFTRYADAMLEEREFFIRKAIGWVLRDTSRKRPELVRDWVAPRTGRMSGVTIREAVKRLPPDEREQLLAAYREKRPASGRPGD